MLEPSTCVHLGCRVLVGAAGRLNQIMDMCHDLKEKSSNPPFYNAADTIDRFHDRTQLRELWVRKKVNVTCRHSGYGQDKSEGTRSRSRCRGP